MPIHSENLIYNRREYRLTLQDCCFRLMTKINGENETVATGFFGREGIRSLQGEIDDGLRKKITPILKDCLVYSTRKKQAPRRSKKEMEVEKQLKKTNTKIPNSITPVNSVSS